jgi:hypothetical protein
LVKAFRREVECNLSELLLGEQDGELGIYGSLETMLDFDKANVEPFPLFVLPQAYAASLEKGVRASLLRKIDASALDRNPTTVMANLAFFYSQDGNEMQSPPRFLGHLAFRHGLISPGELETALNIPTPDRQHIMGLISNEALSNAAQQTNGLTGVVDYVDKQLSTPARFGWLEVFLTKTEKGAWELDAGKPKDQKPVERLLSKTAHTGLDEMFDEIVKSVITHRLSNIGLCSADKLRAMLRTAVVVLGKYVDADPDTWRMRYVRDKLLPIDNEMLTEMMVAGVSLGYNGMGFHRTTDDLACRACGMVPVAVEDKSILMGKNTHKFHNQTSKQKTKEAPKTCLRCAICTYLMVKLLGSEALGQPQVPKTYNLIFHYGKHSHDDLAVLMHQVDLIWGQIQTHQRAERYASDIRDAVKELKARLKDVENTTKEERVAVLLTEKQMELADAEAAVVQATDELWSLCTWLTEPVAPSANPSLDILANAKLGDAKTERHILGLGMNGYRMVLFVLPQLKPRRGKRGEPPPDPYETQRRFSESRIPVTALLSFLRELCGCDGPFYYQSLPSLTPDAFQRDTFYIHNTAISARQAQEEYEVITQLAWKLVWQRGSDGFVKKVVLADKLLEDPMGTFASVMRDSPILGQKKGHYKRLPEAGTYREDWRAYDLTEYARFIQRLSRLREVE